MRPVYVEKAAEQATNYREYMKEHFIVKYSWVGMLP
jgi:hypothetical protein